VVVVAAGVAGAAVAVAALLDVDIYTDKNNQR
jgi:hypothetical protein